MDQPYRSWDDRRRIIRAAIAETNPEALASFHLTSREDAYYRARAARAVENLAKKTSSFKAFYALRPKRPFGYVIGMAALIIAGAIAFGSYVWLTSQELKDAYSLLGTLFAVVVAAIGWSVAAWIAHRNMVRQNTTNILFARFSQAPFGEAMHRFHKKFGFELQPRITKDDIDGLRATKQDDELKTAASVLYLLNYFEFISAGVLRGDLDPTIVRQSVRGFIEHYHDKCEPYIQQRQVGNPRVYEHLRKVRAHYREP